METLASIHPLLTVWPEEMFMVEMYEQILEFQYKN